MASLNITCQQQKTLKVLTWNKVTTLIDTINVKLRKYNDVVGMTSTICDPVFLCQWGWSIYNKFLGFLVICRCCFHLHCIVTIAKFCQTKASHILKWVNTLGVIQKKILVQIRKMVRKIWSDQLVNNWSHHNNSIIIADYPLHSFSLKNIIYYL